MSKSKKRTGSFDPDTKIIKSDLLQNQNSLDYESQDIHKNLGQAIKLFSYWASRVERYIAYDQELHRLEQELISNQDSLQTISKRSQRPSMQEHTKISNTEILKNMLEKFDQNKKQSEVVKEFLILFKERNSLTNLTIDSFKEITEDTVRDISKNIKLELVNVTQDTLTKNIKTITSAIKAYQSTLKTADNVEQDIKSITGKITEIKSNLEQIEELQFTPDLQSNDSTNFVAAEIGFLVKFKYNDNIYYHYPITLPNKNTFSIYNLQNEEYNYIFTKNENLLYGNCIIDDSIVNNRIKAGKKARNKADPSNDYHSESALFFLLQQRDFQEKIINKLKKDLQKQNNEVINLEKIILEIHSTNDICNQCFSKAEYLVNWKEENEKLIQAKKGTHFLKYFETKLTKFLKDNQIIEPQLTLDLQIEIQYSYDKDYTKASKDKNPYIIRWKNNNEELSNADNKTLSKYSIIVSGGSSDAHKNYAYAYNKAVESVRVSACEIIRSAFKKKKNLCNTPKTNDDTKSGLHKDKPTYNNNIDSAYSKSHLSNAISTSEVNNQYTLVQNPGGGDCAVYAIKDALKLTADITELRKAICHATSQFFPLWNFHNTLERQETESETTLQARTQGEYNKKWKSIKKYYQNIFHDIEVFKNTVIAQYIKPKLDNINIHETTKDSLIEIKTNLLKVTDWKDYMFDLEMIQHISNLCNIFDVFVNSILEDHKLDKSTTDAQKYYSIAEKSGIWLNNSEMSAYLLTKGYVLKSRDSTQGSTYVIYQNVHNSQEIVFCNNGVDVSASQSSSNGTHWMAAISKVLAPVVQNNELLHNQNYEKLHVETIGESHALESLNHDYHS
jgi:hypothetical protein